MPGSVERRGKNRWRLTYPMGLDKNGKQIRLRETVTAHNKSEAKRKLNQFIHQIEKENYIPTKRMKFEELVTQWQENYVNLNCEPSTQSKYESITRTHLLPYFKGVYIDNIDPLFVLNYMRILTKPKARQSTKRGQGVLKPATRQLHYFVLRSIFSHAVEWKLISKSQDPMNSVPKPVVKREPREPYNVSDIKKLFKALEGESFDRFLAIKLALYTGLRKSEISGLQWSDIDFDKKILYVKKSLYYADPERKYYRGNLKSANSKRKIKLPKSLINDLNKLKEKQDLIRPPKEQMWMHGKYNYIFVNYSRNFKPLFPQTISKWFHRFLIRKHLKMISFHDLRHTIATLLITLGEQPKNIEDLLGHANIGITMDTYGYMFEEPKQHIADEVDNVLSDITVYKSKDEKKKESEKKVNNEKKNKLG